MSTETQTPAVDRGIVERIRASPFLSQLLSNRLAVTGLGIIALVVALAVYARFTYDLETLLATQFGVNPDEAPPSAQYPFGTDGQARNIFPRVLYGAWYAILYGTVTVAASTALGVGLGIVAAYYGDLTDNVIMRTMDVLLSFPSLLLALALVTIFPEELGLWRAVGALTLVYTPRFARVVRGAALKVLEDGAGELPTVQLDGAARERFDGLVAFTDSSPERIAQTITRADEELDPEPLREYASSLSWGRIAEDYETTIREIV